MSDVMLTAIVATHLDDGVGVLDVVVCVSCRFSESGSRELI